MKRKLLGLLLTMTMVMSLLVGCGEGAKESADKDVNESVNESVDGGNNEAVNQESDSGEKESEVNTTVEEQDESNAVTGESEPAISEESEVVSSEKEEDKFVEVTSFGGVKVKVYYDPDVVTSYYIFDPEVYLTDAEGNEYVFAIADFESAEARRKGREDYFNSQKMLEDVYVSELEELQAGEYIIKQYQADYMVYSYDGSGELTQGTPFRESVIELGSGVVCVFDSAYLDDPEFGVFLLDVKFVIE